MNAAQVVYLMFLTVLATLISIGAIIAVRGWWKEKWAVVREMRRDFYGVDGWGNQRDDGPNGMNVYKLHRRVAVIEAWLKSDDGQPFRAYGDPTPEPDEDDAA